MVVIDIIKFIFVFLKLRSADALNEVSIINVIYMEKMFFIPWVGKNYETGGIFGKRVMVLGDSHYRENKWEASSNNTKEVIETFLNSERDFDKYMNTFTKFERAVFNSELNQTEKEEFWHSILFYNYLQEPLTEPGANFDYGLYEKYFEPFMAVLETHQPDVIIAWGQRLFTAMPGGNGKDGIPLSIDNIPYKKCWIYTLKNGHQVKMFAINHPSRGFSREKWHKIIKAALEQ